MNSIPNRFDLVLKNGGQCISHLLRKKRSQAADVADIVLTGQGEGVFVGEEEERGDGAGVLVGKSNQRKEPRRRCEFRLRRIIGQTNAARKSREVSNGHISKWKSNLQNNNWIQDYFIRREGINKEQHIKLYNQQRSFEYQAISNDEYKNQMSSRDTIRSSTIVQWPISNNRPNRRVLALISQLDAEQKQKLKRSKRSDNLVLIPKHQRGKVISNDRLLRLKQRCCHNEKLSALEFSESDGDDDDRIFI
jgi:hypothetical protein